MTCQKITNEKGEEVDKPKDQYTTSDWDKLMKHFRAEHIVYCGLNVNKYNIISA